MHACANKIMLTPTTTQYASGCQCVTMGLRVIAYSRTYLERLDSCVNELMTFAVGGISERLLAARKTTAIRLFT